MKLRNRSLMKSVFALLLLGTSFWVSAQQKTVNGKVTDALGKPLQGITVKSKNNKALSVTTQDGSFQIDAVKGDVLEFTSVGYQKWEQKVKGNEPLIAVLTTTTSNLDEVVVVGYGTTSRKNLTLSIAKVDPKDVPSAANNSVAQLLFGRAAGLRVVQQSAEPGGAINLAIRGRGNPLIVVDGIAMP